MKKIIAIVMTFAAVVMFGVSKVNAQATSLQLKSAKVLIDDPTAGAVNSAYTFQFTQPSTSSIDKVELQFCREASGASCTPTSTTFASATYNTGSTTGLPSPDQWTMTTGAGKLTFAAATQSINQNTAVSIKVDTISNGALDTNCQTVGGGPQPDNSSSCYIWIKVTNGGNPVADTVITYTRVEAVKVTAKVDPTFTFLVSGVDSNTARNGVTSSVTTTYSSLPFGNLTVGTPKYAMHELRVKTNTTSGYTVSAFMSQQLTGVYTNNNIDPFATGTYAVPAAWGHPNGTTANDNTGWFGFDTSDTDIPGGAAAWVAAGGKFAGLDKTARVIMQNDRSDDGNSPVYITYALEANVFQPSDSYTGYLVYNALPTY